MARTRTIRVQKYGRVHIVRYVAKPEIPFQEQLEHHGMSLHSEVPRVTKIPPQSASSNVLQDNNISILC